MLLLLAGLALHSPSIRVPTSRPAIRRAPPIGLSGMLTGAAARLAGYDVNNDGVLSPEELSAAYEDAANRVCATSVSTPIIRQFEDRPSWLWAQWRGTVFEAVWRFVLGMVTWACMCCAGIRWLEWHTGAKDWPLFSAPDGTHLVVQRLSSINVCWGFVMSLTTFIVTFFLGQTYSYWRNSFSLGRSIQGRLHDMNMMLAAHAKRDKNGEYTKASAAILESTQRNLRLLHAFFWMSNDDSLGLLHHPAALPRLVDRGLLTEAERKTLVEGGAPERQRHNVVLGWICARFAKAVDDGVLLGGAGFEQEFLAQACLLRAKMGTLPDERVDRMPLAYMHIVQVLVDMLCVLSPIALYPKVRALSHSPDHTRPKSSHARVAPSSVYAGGRALDLPLGDPRALLPRLPLALQVVPRPLRQLGLEGAEHQHRRLPRRVERGRAAVEPARRARAGVTREIGTYGLWGGCAGTHGHQRGREGVF